jgi:hypothetical protein
MTDVFLDGRIMDNVPLPSQTQQFAVTMQNNWTDTFYLALFPNGTIVGQIEGKHNASIQNLNMEQTPCNTNLSAIATTTDGMFYSICNDTILEYSFNKSHPFDLNYVGQVYP